MVISSDFRMGENRDDDHEEDAPYFTVINLFFTVSSRLANILGLSSRDIPLCLREQFGYAKKNSLIFEAQYDTTGNYKYNVVPVSLSFFRISTITLYKLRNNNHVISDLWNKSSYEPRSLVRFNEITNRKRFLLYFVQFSHREVCRPMRHGQGYSFYCCYP